MDGDAFKDEVLRQTHVTATKDSATQNGERRASVGEELVHRRIISAHPRYGKVGSLREDARESANVKVPSISASRPPAGRRRALHWFSGPEQRAVSHGASGNHAAVEYQTRIKLR